jgi:uncharacterized protein YidB (DUF937 family)
MMGVLGNLATKELGNLGGGKGGMVMAIMKMIESHPGGIQGLLKDFEQNGMGDAVKSWLGDGQNTQVSPEQVNKAVGQQDVQKVADQAGVSHEQASSSMASLLPEILDKLSPNGQAPQQNELMSKGMDLLKGHLGL